MTLSANDRSVEFTLDLDMDFIQDRNLMHCVQQDGCCEPEVLHVLFRALRTGDVAFDAGAAIGYFTVLMSKLVGETGVVFSCEPGPNNIEKLRRNIALNAAKNVVVFKKPLWSHALERPFYVYEDSGSNSLQPIAGAHLSSPILQTTTVVEVCNGFTPRLIKIDCEGAELHIIKGFIHDDWMIPFVVMELNQAALDYFSSSPLEIMRKMQQRGYQLFLLHRDGALPSMIPETAYKNIRFARANTNVLFSTWDKVIEAWPEIHP